MSLRTDHPFVAALRRRRWPRPIRASLFEWNAQRAILEELAAGPATRSLLKVALPADVVSEHPSNLRGPAVTSALDRLAAAGLVRKCLFKRGHVRLTLKGRYVAASLPPGGRAVELVPLWQERPWWE